jgi:hypothetical protein
VLQRATSRIGGYNAVPDVQALFQGPLKRAAYCDGTPPPNGASWELVIQSTSSAVLAECVDMATTARLTGAHHTLEISLVGISPALNMSGLSARLTEGGPRAARIDCIIID